MDLQFERDTPTSPFRRRHRPFVVRLVSAVLAIRPLQAPKPARKRRGEGSEGRAASLGEGARFAPPRNQEVRKIVDLVVGAVVP